MLVHTGQNYDYELNEVFFSDLGIRKPDHFLNVDTTSLGKVIGNTIIGTEEILVKEKPDAVLILGDTNSSLAAIMAKRLKIPIYHMEAGNRSFDQNVPEEINRKIVDRISDFNLVYTENSRRHLLSEGLPHRRIYLTGSPMTEVLNFYGKKIEGARALENLELAPKEYILVSFHREENVDKPAHLIQILNILEAVKKEFGKKIIVSTHPRTQTRIEQHRMALPREVQFLKPFGFFDYIKLQKEAFCTMSDSGTISEESAILGFPAVTLRRSMERPEAMDAGSIILTGMDEEIVLQSIRLAIEQQDAVKEIPEEYKITNTSHRVLKIIMGTARLSNSWDGIIKND